MSEVHVYAKARMFIVVPVCAGEERQPVQEVELIIGRDSVGMLADAIRDAQAANCESVSAWDGDGGKWWKYHLMQASLVWDGDVVHAKDEDRTQADLDAGNLRNVAEWLIKRVKVRLT